MKACCNCKHFEDPSCVFRCYDVNPDRPLWEPEEEEVNCNSCDTSCNDPKGCPEEEDVLKIDKKKLGFVRSSFPILPEKEPPKPLPNPFGDDTRSYNVGTSDYSKHKIQPWDIWLEYNLNPWDADIIKRVLRDKDGDSRELDYEKIIHVCKERIRQIKNAE